MTRNHLILTLLIAILLTGCQSPAGVITATDSTITVSPEGVNPLLPPTRTTTPRPTATHSLTQTATSPLRPIPTWTEGPTPTTVQVTSDLGECVAPPGAGRGWIDMQRVGSNVCILWADTYDNETGFRLVLRFDNTGEMFVYETSPNISGIPIPPELTPPLDQSFEYCVDHHVWSLDIYALLLHQDPIPVTGMAFNGECNNFEMPSATPTAPPIVGPSPQKTDAAQPTTPTDAPPSSTNNISFAAGISADGRFLAFTSYNDRLVPGDTNGVPDAFVFDRETGAIERVSVTSDGEELPGWTHAISMSADGRFVLFSSDIRSMQLFDSNLPGGLFLHDRQTGQTESLRLEIGRGTTDYNVANGKISADGRFVIMEVHNNRWNVFLLDRQTNEVKRLSQAPDGTPANGSSHTTAMTPDGRWVAFLSQASNLVPGDRPCTAERWRCADLFVYDRENAKLERIPVGYGMCLGCPADRLTISADGRWIAYNDMDDQNRFLVKVYDRQTQQSTTVCADHEGYCSGHTPAISADGRWLAFANQQVYVQDQQNGQIQQVSITRTGQPADGVSGMINLQGEGFSSDVQISADGQWIAFSSQAINLLPDGVKKQSCTLFLDIAYPCYDLFLYHQETGETIWVNTQQP